MEQKKRKRRKKRTKKRSAISKVGLFFLILLLVLLLLGITVSAGWLWMNYSGQSRLSQKQEAIPELMQQAESEAESEMMLEAGSIRYHGKVYTYKKDILTFLFLGIDKNGEVKASSNLFKGGQADALFLAVLDPGEKKISVIGINRDTMASMNVYDKNGRYSGRQTAQIALSHAYGDGLEESCENSLDAVSNLFYGLPIHGYCALNMSVVSKLNDAVGGVDVVIPESAKGLDNRSRGAFRGRCGVPVYSLSRYGAGTECRSTPGASKAVFEEIYPSGKKSDEAGYDASFAIVYTDYTVHGNGCDCG